MLSDTLEKQRQFYRTGATHPTDFRLDALARLELAISSRSEEIEQALTADLGKPPLESYLAEYYFVLQEIRLFRKRLNSWLKPQRVSTPIYSQPARSWSQLDPLGQSLILSPWNYPVQLALSPLMASVAAGNTVVLKPSETAPASAELLAAIVAEVFSPEHVKVVTGDASVSEELTGLDFDHIFYTGSTEIGRKVYQKAAEKLTPVVLELGGKCPCILDGTFDAETAAQRILFGKFFNGGQTCFAPDFVAVPREKHAETVEAFRSVLMNHPWEDELSHIVSDKHFDRVQGLVTSGAIAKGDDNTKDKHIAPRLLPDATWASDCMQEEIFGPLLPIVAYDSEADLFQHVPVGGSPLALYIFTSDDDFFQKTTRLIPSGSVCRNDVSKQATNLKLPFGGVGDSGFGRYRGHYGLQAFSNDRAYTARPSWGDWASPLPPRDTATKWIKKFMK